MSLTMNVECYALVLEDKCCCILACGRQYVDVIHTVLHKNIDRLGPYYQLFFNLNGNPV